MTLPVDSSGVNRILFRPGHVVPVSLDSFSSTLSVDSFLYNITSTTDLTIKAPYDLDSPPNDDGLPSIVIKVDSPSSHQHLGSVPSGSDEALLNRSSVLFVAVSFILLMVISLAWLVFYYIQRFRYLHSKERVSRRLAELAKKAVARIPVKTLHSRDKEINLEHEQCAICIEQFRPLDTVRVLPCRHFFHKVCIDPWLLEQRSCPMCKLDILQAYGMRTDGFCAHSRQESTEAMRHISDGSAGNSASSHPASASGSDDGMILERIALVHSTPTPPPLTYVVLTTASVASTHQQPLVCQTAGTIYYVRNSDTSITTPSSNAATVLPSDCSHTIIPLTNPILVSVLPGCSTTTNASQPSSNLSVLSHDPTMGGLVLWNPSSQCGCTSHTHSPTTCLSWSHCQSPSNPYCDQSKPNNKATCDITYTTQTFTGPVCSVVTNCNSVDPNMLLREPLISTTSGQPASHSIDSVYLISHDPPNFIRQPFEQLVSPTVSLTHTSPHYGTSLPGVLNKFTHPFLTRVNRRSTLFSWFPTRFRSRNTTSADKPDSPSSSPYTHSFLPPDRVVNHRLDNIVCSSIDPIPPISARSLDSPDPHLPPTNGSQSVVVAVVETFPPPSDSPVERLEPFISHNLPTSNNIAEI